MRCQTEEREMSHMAEGMENNRVSLMGRIVSPARYCYETYGEVFYRVDIEVERRSDTADQIPLMLPGWMMGVKRIYVGKKVNVKGQFRSCFVDGHKKLYVFAWRLELADQFLAGDSNNKIFLDGFICKEPVYRKTPLGREITDLMIAVDRQYDNSDYIPAICWGIRAKEAAQYKVGSHVQLLGRIQSRKYKKRLGEAVSETRVAYEVSVRKVEYLG